MFDMVHTAKLRPRVTVSSVKSSRLQRVSLSLFAKKIAIFSPWTDRDSSPKTIENGGQLSSILFEAK